MDARRDKQNAGKREGPRRLEDLEIQELLALAIHIERANARRFRTFAGSFHGYDEEVVRRFEELAREEDCHEWKLADEFRRHFGEPVPSVEEADVGEVIEAVDLDDAEHQIFNSLSPLRVYELGLRAEEEARAFYLRAAGACQDQHLAGLYRDLGAMEDDHVAWFQEKIRAAKRAGE